MRTKLIGRALMAVSALSLAAAPLAADAKPRQKHRVWVCDKNVKGIANTGTAAGAVAGGLLGHAIGGHTTGTLLGAGAGAYAGRRIAKGRAERNCHYEYRYR